jgi:hypothetical protein
VITVRTRPTRRRGLAARLARILGLDGNPLRRASDRAEAWIRIGLLAAFLVAGPLAAVGAAHWAYHSGITAVRAQAEPRHSVQTALWPPVALANLTPAGRGGPDTSGHAATAPQPDQLAGETVAVLMTLVLVALALLVVLRLTQRLLNRRRLAAWGAAWSAIGPQWTGRAP